MMLVFKISIDLIYFVWKYVANGGMKNFSQLLENIKAIEMLLSRKLNYRSSAIFLTISRLSRTRYSANIEQKNIFH